MTATKLYSKNIEVLTETEFNALMDLRKNERNSYRVPTSHELRAETIKRIEADAKLRRLQTRRFRNIAIAGILTIGIGLGLSYYLNNSAPTAAYGATPSAKIATGDQAVTVQHATKTVSPKISVTTNSNGFDLSANATNHNPS